MDTINKQEQIPALLIIEIVLVIAVYFAITLILIQKAVDPIHIIGTLAILTLLILILGFLFRRYAARVVEK